MSTSGSLFPIGDFESRKRKEKKAKKKEKKEKKRRKRERSSSSSSSSDSSGEDEKWEEKSAPKEREEWMSSITPSLFPCMSVGEQRTERQNKKLREKEEALAAMKEMLQKRELNPSMREGGTSAPPSTSGTSEGKMVGDGGKSFYLKALKRAKETAAEQGITLEEVAADRFGSLEKLYQLIEDAEKRSEDGVGRRDDSRDWKRGREERKWERVQGEGSRREKSRGKWRMGEAEERRIDSDRGRVEKRIRVDDEKRRERDSWGKEEGRERDGGREERRERSKLKVDWSQGKREFSRPREDDDGKVGGGSKGRGVDEGVRKRWRKEQNKKEIMLDTRKEDVDTRREDLDTTRGDVDTRRGDLDTRREDVDTRRGDLDTTRGDVDTRRKDTDTRKGDVDTRREEAEEVVVDVMTEAEMNKLSARILKAELMGKVEEVKKLKEKLERAREVAKDKGEAEGRGKTMFAARKESAKTGAGERTGGEKTVVLTRVTARGMEAPLLGEGSSRLPASKGKKVKTHDEGGRRMRYFADDDVNSLKKMFEREKTGTAQEQNTMLSSLVGRGMETTDDGKNYDMDDVMVSRMSDEKVLQKSAKKERQLAIGEHLRRSKALDSCSRCYESSKMMKHLIVSLGKHSCLCLPAHKSLVEGHCLIIPLNHVTASTHVDEDVWEEMSSFAKALVRMFQDNEDGDCVFFEMSRNLRYFPHMALECVPLPREVGDLAPIYFKKALQESESEWATNKKVVDVKGGPSNIRRSVPQGLPYFFVNFGWSGDGFAHVIEDEDAFPANFAHEIIGGMLELEPSAWRKPKPETTEEQMKKVVEFSKRFQSFDFTRE
ncbi:unnamed protein product [Cyprideis torosa]|uniref:Uncharacterized protein n=1 Tax=Cyprideis torosa TaxID=163714 RepID=A0A7R8WEW1_9CRUS|nr:unnamed protein product [Cyprideis torosa]CAG0890248.1 unnamed protein product [Cyprideis torosa]